MAEGDTVLRAARRLELLVDQTLAVSTPNPRGRVGGLEKLDGRRLKIVTAHGKNLLLHFGGWILHSHLGMNGSWHVQRRNSHWRRPRHSAWAILTGDEWEAAQFGGPTLRVLSAARLSTDRQLSRLGPDVLAARLDESAVLGSLRGAGPGRELGEALLDQSLIAGIGNIFKSEGCFEAKLSPWRTIGRLPDADLLSVVLATRKMMEASVAGAHRPRAVYRRAGAPCPVCGATIRSRGQGDANRTTYWCPRCQPDGL